MMRALLIPVGVAVGLAYAYITLFHAVLNPWLLVAVGAAFWFLYTFSDIVEVVRRADKELALDLAADGLRGLGYGLILLLVWAVIQFVPTYTIELYYIYLTGYGIGWFASGVMAASVFSIALGFGIWLFEKQ